MRNNLSIFLQFGLIMTIGLLIMARLFFVIVSTIAFVGLAGALFGAVIHISVGWGANSTVFFSFLVVVVRWLIWWLTFPALFVVIGIVFGLSLFVSFRWIGVLIVLIAAVGVVSLAGQLAWFWEFALLLGSVVVVGLLVSFAAGHCLAILSISLLRIIILLLLIVRGPASLFLDLHLHLEALLLFSLLLLLGLFVLFDFGRDLLLGKESDALIEDVKMHFDDLWIFHEERQLGRILALFV